MTPAATRTAATAALAALAVLVLGGCAGEGSLRLQTQDFYTAGDGVNAQAGDLGVRNLLLVADADPESETSGSATVLVTVANPGPEPDALLEVQVGGVAGSPEGGPLEIPARGYGRLGGDGERLQLDGVEARPGSFVPVTLVFESAPQVTLRALVQASDAWYADAGPTPAEVSR